MYVFNPYCSGFFEIRASISYYTIEEKYMYAITYTYLNLSNSMLIQLFITLPLSLYHHLKLELISRIL